jgi:uncharacterized protein YndB with AHSA1/START domain
MTDPAVHRLRYRWLIEGPIDVVFDILVHGTAFPDWWRPVFLEAHTDDPESVVGARVRYRVRGRLPYGLDWDVTLRRIERPHLIENETVVILGGRLRLSGPVRFRLGQQGDRVEVINEQEMRSERRLPRPIRAVWQRVFSYNHDWAMAKGGIGLQRAVRERLARTPSAEPVEGAGSAQPD